MNNGNNEITVIIETEDEKFSIKTSLEETIEAFRNKFSAQINIEIVRIALVYKGDILIGTEKSDINKKKKLSDYNIKDGDRMYAGIRVPWWRSVSDYTPTITNPNLPHSSRDTGESSTTNTTQSEKMNNGYQITVSNPLRNPNLPTPSTNSSEKNSLLRELNNSTNPPNKKWSDFSFGEKILSILIVILIIIFFPIGIPLFCYFRNRIHKLAQQPNPQLADQQQSGSSKQLGS